QTNQSHNGVRRDGERARVAVIANGTTGGGGGPPEAAEKKSQNNPMQRTFFGLARERFPYHGGPGYHPPSSTSPADGSPPATKWPSRCGSVPRSSARTAARPAR